MERVVAHKSPQLLGAEPRDLLHGPVPRNPAGGVQVPILPEWPENVKLLHPDEVCVRDQAHHPLVARYQERLAQSIELEESGDLPIPPIFAAASLSSSSNLTNLRPYKNDYSIYGRFQAVPHEGLPNSLGG